MKRVLQKLLTLTSPSYRRMGLLDARIASLENKIDDLARVVACESDQHFFRIGAMLNSASGVTGAKRETPLIVSLTTIPKRFGQVHMVIESILQQSLKPDRLVLWLDHDSFGGREMPNELEAQQERGLEICYCDNIRSYKKLVFSLQEWPHATLVTADDDVLYPRDWLDALFQDHMRFPGCVVCHRAHKIRFDAQGAVLPHNQWEYETMDSGPLLDLYPTGSGGILYPAGSLDDRASDTESFLKLAPTEDDLWFKAMGLLKGTPVRKVEGGIMNDSKAIVLRGSQEEALCKINVAGDGNYAQIKNVFDHFDLQARIGSA